jgi:hypothetical protein
MAAKIANSGRQNREYCIVIKVTPDKLNVEEISCTKLMIMEKNVGGTEKAIRLLVAVVAVALNLTGVTSGTLAIVLYVVAGLMVLTSLLSFCPLWTVFGINTCSVKK